MLFNSLLCRADRDLAEIPRLLGGDPYPFEERARKTADAVNAKLWDEQRGTYLDYDLVSGHPMRVFASPNFVPLFAGIPDEGRARRVVGHLTGPCFRLGRGGAVPVPSYDPRGFGFSPERYWRGPVWVNIDWLLLRGLERYGYTELADTLRDTIVRLCREEGFYEYFDPTTGMGHGSDLFSWTAALLLDMVLENVQGGETG